MKPHWLMHIYGFIKCTIKECIFKIQLMNAHDFEMAKLRTSHIEAGLTTWLNVSSQSKLVETGHHLRNELCNAQNNRQSIFYGEKSHRTNNIHIWGTGYQFPCFIFNKSVIFIYHGIFPVTVRQCIFRSFWNWRRRSCH